MVSATSMSLRQSTTYVQRQLDLLAPWFTKWRIKANAEKCEGITFTRKTQLAARHQLRLNGAAVPWRRVVKYLGVVLDQKLTMTPHVTRVCRLARGGANSLLPLLRSPKLSVKTKVRLYTALLRPVTTYAAPAWYHLTSKTARQAIAATQAKFLRRATASPWFVRNSVIRDAAGIQPIKTFVEGLTERFEEKMHQSTWDHIQQLAVAEVPQLRAPMED